MSLDMLPLSASDHGNGLRSCNEAYICYRLLHSIVKDAVDVEEGRFRKAQESTLSICSM